MRLTKPYHGVQNNFKGWNPGRTVVILSLSVFHFPLVIDVQSDSSPTLMLTSASFFWYYSLLIQFMLRFLYKTKKYLGENVGF